MFIIIVININYQMKCLDSFDNMCARIVKPLKFKLNQRQIIQRQIKGKSLNYQNFTVKNQRGFTLSCLIFINNLQTLPTILYLHGNGGSKLQILPMIRIQSKKYNICSFDFTGCGKSQGEFITYGKNQVKDIETVIQHLKNVYKILEICVWGRSMGAVAAILYAKNAILPIRAMILDSPFTNLEKVLKNVAKKQSIPAIFFFIAFFFIKNKISGIVQTNIFEESFLNVIKSYNHIPILFGYSEIDEIVVPEDVLQLYHAYSGEKNKFLFESSHCDQRPNQFIIQAFNIIQQKTNIKLYSNNYSHTVRQTSGKTHYHSKSNIYKNDDLDIK